MKKPDLDTLKCEDVLRGEIRQMRIVTEEQQKGLVALSQRNAFLTQLLCAVVYKHVGTSCTVTVTPDDLDELAELCAFRVRTTYYPSEDGKSSDVALGLELVSPEHAARMEAAKAAVAALTTKGPRRVDPIDGL